MAETVARPKQKYDPYLGAWVDPVSGDIWDAQALKWNPPSPDERRLMQVRERLSNPEPMAIGERKWDENNGQQRPATSPNPIWGSVPWLGGNAAYENLPEWNADYRKGVEAPPNTEGDGNYGRAWGGYDFMRGDTEEARMRGIGPYSVDEDPNIGRGSRYTDYKYYDQLGQATNNPFTPLKGTDRKNKPDPYNPVFNEGTGRYDYPTGANPDWGTKDIAKAAPSAGFEIDIRTGQMVPVGTAKAAAAAAKAAPAKVAGPTASATALPRRGVVPGITGGSPAPAATKPRYSDQDIAFIRSAIGNPNWTPS